MSRRSVNKIFTSCILFYVLYSTSVTSEYTKKDAVIILTEKNFDKMVLQSNDYWLVEFYAPWCGHCKNLEPEWKGAAKKLRTKARLGAVDATVHQNLAQKYGIRGYPTIKEFGSNKKKPQDYQGVRTKKDIIQYVKNSPEAQKLGVSGVDIPILEFTTVSDFVLTKSNNKIPSALFFGSKTSKSKKPPKWLSELAQSFVVSTKRSKKNKKKASTTSLQIAFITGQEQKIVQHLKIPEDNLPTIVYIDPKTQKYTLYTEKSKLELTSAKKFLTEQLTKTQEDVEKEFTTLPLFPTVEVPKKKPQLKLSKNLKVDTSMLNKCLTKKGAMCTFIFTSTTKEEEQVLEDTLKKYRRDPFKFFVFTQVFNKEDNPLLTELLQAIDVKQDATAPSVVVIKPGKKPKYISKQGEKDLVDNTQMVETFLDTILQGSATFQPLPSTFQLTKDSSNQQQQHEEL